MSCVSLASMRVLFNGDTNEMFYPTRGIRQGDHLSPYLFVLYVKRLAHCIHDMVGEGRWKPIALNRGGPQLSHLFFADDLLLFGKASTEQMLAMSECLNNFCKASGELVSVEKTHMLMSKNVNSNVALELRNISGFSLSHGLGKYLGVPLLHERANRNTYNHLLERTQQRLSSWRAETLSFAGRVTLAQSVVAALPTYTMQTTLLPRHICSKLERMNRDFVWGSNDNACKCHTVAWSNICQKRELGGLGFRDLHAFHQAFFMKLS